MAEAPRSQLLLLRNSTDEPLNGILRREFETFDVLTHSDLANSPPSDLPHREPISTFEFDPLNDDVFCYDFFHHRDNQVNFVMDLIHERIEQPETTHVMPGSDVGHELARAHLEMDLGLDFLTDELQESDESFVFSGGLRVGDTGSGRNLGSEPDPDFQSRIAELDSDGGFDQSEENYRIVSGNDDESDGLLFPLWDSLVLSELNGHSNRGGNEDFEWEEIEGRVDETEVLNTFLDDNNVQMSALVHEEEGGGDALESLEWEVLLNRELHFEEAMDWEVREYGMFVRQFVEGENMGIGKPPASEKVVDRLLTVHVSKGHMEKGNLACAVCRDEMTIGDKARELPCGHMYHGDCILPWLRIRNTCPVCRYELPTDDPDYERRRAQRANQVN